MPKPVLNQLKKHHWVDEIYIRGKKILGADKDLIHFMHGAFPVLNEFSKMLSKPIDITDESPQLKWEGYMTGIGRMALDLERQMRNQYFLQGKHYQATGYRANMESFMREHGRLPDESEKEMLKPLGMKDIE